MCLYARELEEVVPIPADLVGCSLDGSGFDPYTGKEEGSRVTKLFAHVHTPCLSGVGYWGWVWMWVPHNVGEPKLAPEPWECGSEKEITLEEFTWTFLENASNGVDDPNA